MEIKEVLSEDEKSITCEKILNALPNWFGIPESIADYVTGVKDKPFYGVFDGDNAVGFVSIKVHSPYTAEIYVMGILENYHRMGIGKRMVQVCEEYCRMHGMEFLTVKTLDEKNPDLYYQKTRLFYESMGFKALEVFPLLWDEYNPCLFLVKHITAAKPINTVQNRFTATGFVFNDDNKILMIKHRKLGVWMPPGGHIDENELPCKAVVREIFEETGVMAKAFTVAHDADSPIDARCNELPLPMEILLTNFEGDGLYNCINMNYICYAKDSTLNPEKSEVDDIGWFSPSQAIELETFEFVRKSLRKAVRYYRHITNSEIHEGR